MRWIKSNICILAYPYIRRRAERGKPLVVGVPKESFPGETRVALVPSGVQTLVSKGIDVVLETGCGVAAGYTDEAYREKGAEFVKVRRDLFHASSLVLQVRGAGANPQGACFDLDLMRKNQILIGLLDPLHAPHCLQTFVEMDLGNEDTEADGGYARAMDEEFYRKQRELLSREMGDADVVITTAAVPGKKAPVLITEEMVKRMQNGAVIVDLAAEHGGNCELTKPVKEIVFEGVKIVGPVNLPATVPYHASQLYSKNITTFLTSLIRDGKIDLDSDDEIMKATLVSRDGVIVHEDLKKSVGKKNHG